jgi:hypothetical protein
VGLILALGGFATIGNVRPMGMEGIGWAGLLMLAGGFAFAVAPFIPRIVMTPDRITVTTFLGRRTLGRNQIAYFDASGLSGNSPAVILYSASPELKRIVIPGYFKIDDQFRAWFSAIPRRPETGAEAVGT